jgi:hypothetical protein
MMRFGKLLPRQPGFGDLGIAGVFFRNVVDLAATGSGIEWRDSVALWGDHGFG